MRGKMDCYGLTDIGKVRKANEDQFLIADLNKSMLIHQTSLSHDDHTRLFGGSQGKLLLVADGMGGHAAGEQASSIAVQSLAHYVLNTMSWFYRLQEEGEADLQDDLKAALEDCETQIEAAVASHAEREGMGTTLTIAYILWPRLYVVHVGDSRCYLLRSGRLEQVTKDQTMAQQMVDKGILSEEDAKGSRWSNVLSSCIGGKSLEHETQVYKAVLQIGDTLLLCSDGLTGGLSDKQLLEVLQQPIRAEETCQRLVKLAIEKGGQDNITVVVAHFRETHPMPAGHVHQEAAIKEGASLESTVIIETAGQPG